MRTALQTGCDLSDHCSKVSILVENSSVDADLVHRKFVENEMFEQTHLSDLNLLNILSLLDLVVCTHTPNVQYLFDRVRKNKADDSWCDFFVFQECSSNVLNYLLACILIRNVSHCVG